MLKRPLKYLRLLPRRRVSSICSISWTGPASAAGCCRTIRPRPSSTRSASTGRFSPVCARPTRRSGRSSRTRAGFCARATSGSFAPREVLFVGDRVDVDAAGAAAAGMPCVIVGAATARIAPLHDGVRHSKGCSVSLTMATEAARVGGHLALRPDRARRPLVQERLHAARRRPGGLLPAATSLAWSSVLAARRSRSLATCLVASSNYVLNELLDGPHDRLHPEKQHRPVPSGAGRARARLRASGWCSRPPASRSRCR